MNNNGSRLTHGRTSVYNLNYHLIWCTKYRNKVLKGQVEQDLKDILYQIANENGYSIDHMEVGLDDHIHLLVSAPPKSSLRLFNMHPHLAERYWKPKTKRSLWSPSYYVESIGAVNEQAVAKYINDQRKKEVG